jgi:2'-5' RNA ligase
MRIFIALELPGTFLGTLAEKTGPLKTAYPAFRWTGLENIHITLAFMGELDEKGLSLLQKAAACAAEGVGVIPACAGRLFTLPRGKTPNALVLGFSRGGEEMAALAARLERAIAETGRAENYPFRQAEKRPFTPHLTLARRGGVPLRLSPEDRNMEIPAEGRISGMTVFRSEFDARKNGPRYTALASWVLADSIVRYKHE